MNCFESISYEARAKKATAPITKRLLASMLTKKSNLVVAADLTRADELLALAESIGPSIVVLKTHVDIIEDFSLQFIEELKAIAHKHQFLLFEDRKFADIGNTVSLQFHKGLYQISQWADIINAHPVPGEGVITGLQSNASVEQGLLLVAQMSSKGNLCSPDYTKNSLAMAEKAGDFVIGFVAQERLSNNPHWLTFTPGIHLESKKDSKGQQYQRPEEAIAKGSDLLIVGRAITDGDSGSKAALYQAAGWQAYEKRTSCH